MDKLDRDVLRAAGLNDDDLIADVGSLTGGFTASGSMDVKRKDLSLHTIAKTYATLITTTEGDGDYYTFLVSDDVWTVFNLELMITTLELMQKRKSNLSKIITKIMAEEVHPRTRVLSGDNYILILQKRHAKQILRFLQIIGRVCETQVS